ncbi:hypothetical protein KY386_02895 [Candidatus Parcubacteria bacterium]|nr:hypothetical protein [Candidatus Parcubacteria bacterium]
MAAATKNKHSGWAACGRRLMAAVLAGLVTSAAGVSALHAATVSQGYAAKEAIAVGSLVSLDRSGPGVVAADSDHAEDLIGVVTTPDESLLSLSPAAGQTQVSVATGGQVLTIVSNLSGAIKRGDAITASPIKGVGMKATTNTKVVGVAQADYDGSQDGSKEVEVTAKSGQTEKVKIGRLPVLVNVTNYASARDSSRTIVPGYLQELANTVAGKEVPALRVVLSLVLLVLVFLSVTVFIYSAVQSSIISIGRNPLSQRSVRYSLAQVLLAAVVVLLLTLGAVYLILTR